MFYRIYHIQYNVGVGSCNGRLLLCRSRFYHPSHPSHPISHSPSTRGRRHPSHPLPPLSPFPPPLFNPSLSFNAMPWGRRHQPSQAHRSPRREAVNPPPPRSCQGKSPHPKVPGVCVRPKSLVENFPGGRLSISRVVFPPCCSKVTSKSHVFFSVSIGFN